MVLCWGMVLWYFGFMVESGSGRWVLGYHPSLEATAGGASSAGWWVLGFYISYLRHEALVGLGGYLYLAPMGHWLWWGCREAVAKRPCPWGTLGPALDQPETSLGLAQP